MEVTFGYIVKAFIFPPGFNLALFAAGFVIRRRMPVLSRWLRIGALLLLWVWSTPVVSTWLYRTVAVTPVFEASDTGDAQAIVALGGGRQLRVPEYGNQDVIGTDSLERLRYAIHLHNLTGLPLAVCGGKVLDPEGVAVGQLMADVAKQDYGIGVRWVETQSRNTAQNAAGLAEIMAVKKIILVTHVLHMPRAVAAFEREGFQVRAAPIGLIASDDGQWKLFDWLPSVGALWGSSAAMHEIVGRWYYRWRYSKS